MLKYITKKNKNNYSIDNFFPFPPSRITGKVACQKSRSVEILSVLVKEAGLKFSIVTHGATGSWLTMPLRSATLRSGEFR